MRCVGLFRLPFRRSSFLLQKVDMNVLKELRFRTEAPIADCSAALKETGGEMDAAITWLRQRGVARATKKSGRITENGALIAVVDKVYGGGIMTICSETDFASRNAHFDAAATQLNKLLAEMINSSKGSILSEPPEDLIKRLCAEGKDILSETISVLGENVTLRGFAPLTIPPSNCEGDEERAAPLAFGRYVHNPMPSGDVGSTVGIVAVRIMTPNAKTDDLNLLAQCFVGNAGDESGYQHQKMLGTDETVGQWLKGRGLRFCSSLVMGFGKEPCVQHPPIRRK